jgi:hypothetical protein
MAITLESGPGTLPSMHDDLWHVASSTNSGLTGMKFVFDVYIASTLVARVKIVPEPGSGYGIFNASNIVRAYWESYFKPIALTSTPSVFNYDGNDIFVAYDLKVGEDYSGVTYTNLATASFTAYNYVNPIYRDYTTAYLSTYNNKFLTTRDKTRVEVRTDERCYIGYLAQTPPASLTASVSVDGGSPISGSSNTSDKFTLCDVSPAAVNAYLGGSYITANTTSYTVTIGGDTVTCYLVCAPHERQRLHFLNHLGGYDSVVFRAVNREEYRAERETYLRREWDLVGSTMSRANAYNVMYGTTVNFATSREMTLDLRSDWLSVTDHNWLRDLITSPEVYLENTSHHFPVVLETSEWIQRHRRTDKSFALNLRVRFGRKTYTQYR